MARHHRGAVFLDRDGTLVRDMRNGADPAALELLAGVPAALRALQQHGYRLVVVTNQSGVARGLFSLAEARAMGTRLAALLAAFGLRLDGYYLCPHHSEGVIAAHAAACGCRKPAPGLLRRAAADLELDLSRSWMVGDTPADMAAGRAAGVRGILVDIGTVRQADVAADTSLARNLPHAAAMALIADGLAATPPPARLAHPIARAELPACRVPQLRAFGEPSAWPDEPWAQRAAADARLLAWWCSAPRPPLRVRHRDQPRR